jgi:hypothetical protein
MMILWYNGSKGHAVGTKRTEEAVTRNRKKICGAV